MTTTSKIACTIFAGVVTGGVVEKLFGFAAALVGAVALLAAAVVLAVTSPDRRLW